jgi:FixJ family two-component response regulator
MPPRADIFLVDDQPAILKAVARLLDMAGYRPVAFESAQAFLDSGNADLPGCLVLDMAMPTMDGLALQRLLRARAGVLPVIFLTGHNDLHMGIQAMKEGAADFLTKPVDSAALLQAVASALECNRIALRERQELQAIQLRLASLTCREREVLDLVAEGKLNKQVASELGTAEHTIKIHRGRAMAKMHVQSLAELVRLMDRCDLLSNSSNRNM